jgi:quercetin dioxygenase-like cupin family protein
MSIKIRKITEEPGENVQEEGYEGVNNVWVSFKREDLDAFSSRLFRLDTNASTPLHEHKREHIAIVIDGKCNLVTNENDFELREGTIITIPSMIPHRFSNPYNSKSILIIMNFFVTDNEIFG